MAANPSPSLFTDLYELTMAQAYWQQDMHGHATFSLFYRTDPPNRAYTVVAGLEAVLEALEALAFNDDDMAYLRTLGIFQEPFLEFLRTVRFTGEVRAMPEGEISFAGEPVMEVSGPIIEAQLVETMVINAVSTATLLASKASRVVHAAQGRRVVEFAARRTQGHEAADVLARSSYIAGCAGTSNVEAAARYGITPVGTMAHSFITSFPSELEAFRAYAAAFPGTSTLLVDTYDTMHGTKNAIIVAKELAAQGHGLRALRLDSGDLAALSKESRQLLDDAGLHDVELFGSGGLDEFDVDDLVREGARFDGFGVGTKMGVSADAPWMDWAYKLVEHRGAPVLKLSTGKATLAGRKQVYRHYTGDGSLDHDVIALESEEAPRHARPLLGLAMHDGQRTAPQESLETMRARCASELAKLPEKHKALRVPEKYPVEHSTALDDVQWRVTQHIVEHELGG